VSDTPRTDQQVRFWNDWNASNRERTLAEISLRQQRVVTHWLDQLHAADLRILDVGCGAGWLSSALDRYGTVTGVDLADEVIARARTRYPSATFVAGDFTHLTFDPNVFDVVVALEVLSHVADQAAFVAKLASHLPPGGLLMLATQNRPVLENYNRIPPPAPGQIRRWVDKTELAALLAPHFDVVELFSVTPIGRRGLMRVVNSHKVNAPIRALVGDRLDRLKERFGLGWTLMCLARRRA